MEKKCVRNLSNLFDDVNHYWHRLFYLSEKL